MLARVLGQVEVSDSEIADAVQLQSVVEEECTGPAAPQCVLSRSRPEAAVIPGARGFRRVSSLHPEGSS